MMLCFDRFSCPGSKVLIFVAVLLALTACGIAEKPYYRVEVEKSASTQGLKGHQKPYSVNGERYEPIRDHQGFVEEGVASWYGPDFHGKPTSCGEIYDMNAMTSAHKILPLGVHVRVTNKNNGKSVVVRVNDRGPFVKNRIIDLSYAAARELDVVAAGTAPVRIEALGFRNSGGYEAPASYETGSYTVQVGAFREVENAKRLSLELKNRYGVSTLQEGWVNGTLFHRVRVGVYPTLAAAEKAAATFEENGFSSCFVVASQ